MFCAMLGSSPPPTTSSSSGFVNGRSISTLRLRHPQAQTRGLVRDLRAFEHRGETVDDDWRARRREIIGLIGVEERLATTDAGEVPIVLAPTLPGGPRLLVGELDPGIDPDNRDPNGDLEEPAATAFELVLEAADRDVAWGLMLCGLELRIYRRGTGISQQYLAMDLDGLVELNDEDLWRAFAGLFRLPAARPDADGVPLIPARLRREPGARDAAGRRHAG